MFRLQLKNNKNTNFYMNNHGIIITSPSLDTNKNIGGISTVTSFVISNNPSYRYDHFELGKLDEEKRGIAWLFRILKAWGKWGFLMIKEKDLIIHFNFALDKRSIIRDSPLILFSQILNKKLVIHLHGGVYLEKDDIPFWIKTLLKLIFKGKAPKIVLSQGEKEIIMKKYNAKNVMALPNSISLKEAGDFNRIYTTESHVKLLYIGRIVKTKGLDYIFEALQILKEQNIPFKFLFAGSGPEKDSYVDKFSHTFGPSFEYKGVVTGKEKIDLLKECSIFLLPSFYEGLPISLLECMSFGLVPVVTPIGSMKDLIKNKENGIFVKMKSSVEIAEAVEYLVNNPDSLKIIGSNARKYIFENHNPIDYINKLNHIYETV